MLCEAVQSPTQGTEESHNLTMRRPSSTHGCVIYRHKAGSKSSKNPSEQTGVRAHRSPLRGRYSACTGRLLLAFVACEQQMHSGRTALRPSPKLLITPCEHCEQQNILIEKVKRIGRAYTTLIEMLCAFECARCSQAQGEPKTSETRRLNAPKTPSRDRFARRDPNCGVSKAPGRKSSI